MIVRALPNAPGHDGIRQFLPSVASLAVLAGLGVAWLGRPVPGRGLRDRRPGPAARRRRSANASSASPDVSLHRFLLQRRDRRD